MSLMQFFDDVGDLKSIGPILYLHYLYLLIHILKTRLFIYFKVLERFLVIKLHSVYFEQNFLG